jgi:uncharacterized protein YcbK (DUF882 family)
MLVPFAALPGLAYAASGARRLRFYHAHTGERLNVTYCEDGAYLPDALAEINYLLRDFRTGEVHVIEPGLLDFVHRIQAVADSRGTFEIFSGYRSPATNRRLRLTTNGVAKNSFHMQGQALDIRLTDVATGTARDIASQLGLGGVGYYPNSDFLHVDTGPVRDW